MLTAQEIFDKVVAHLYAQGGPARTGTVGCVYRTEDGRKCAAGALLAEGEYHEGLDHCAFPGVATAKCRYREHGIEGALVRSGVPGSLFGLVADLQATHDSCVEPWPPGSTSRARLNQFLTDDARQYNLRFEAQP